MSGYQGRIVGGIEWLPDPLDGDAEEPWCARCGSSCEWLPCPNCGGEGFSHHDCGEDCCACLHPEDNVVCDWCQGRGGSQHCVSSPEWCEGNPLPGRGAIPSTALNPRAWND